MPSESQGWHSMHLYVSNVAIRCRCVKKPHPATRFSCRILLWQGTSPEVDISQLILPIRPSRCRLRCRSRKNTQHGIANPEPMQLKEQNPSCHRKENRLRSITTEPVIRAPGFGIRVVIPRQLAGCYANGPIQSALLHHYYCHPDAHRPAVVRMPQSLERSSQFPLAGWRGQNPKF